MGRTSLIQLFWEYPLRVLAPGSIPLRILNFVALRKAKYELVKPEDCIVLFIPGDCSYEGAADLVNQQNDSKVSVGELYLTILNSKGL